MVDIHHHLLPGLDDGAKDLETSVEMARMAAEDGITHVIATPHASNRYTFDPGLVAERLASLREAVAAQGIPLTIATGCDFHLSYDNIQDAERHPRKYTLNSTPYLLVELPDHGFPPSLSETFYELRVAGMVPILTHPERNPTLQSAPDRLMPWLREGLLIQITTSSVVGEMGTRAKKMAHQLLANRWVHFLATDSHNVKTRPPRMSEARDVVARKYGQAYAHSLCTANPQAVFNSNELPEQDPPLHLYEEEDRMGLPWWKRIFKP
jgi:protein-tyrosine phosphatase